MLKWKQSKKGIAISLRKKNSDLSFDMLKGFSIAIAFHFLLFLLFRVTSNYDVGDTPLLPPVSVTVELDVKPGLFKSESQLTLTSLQPLESPTQPTLPFCTFHPYRDEISTQEPDFSPLEKIPYVSFFEEEV